MPYIEFKTIFYKYKETESAFLMCFRQGIPLVANTEINFTNEKNCDIIKL